MVLNWKEILLYLFENKPQIIFSHKTNKEKHRIGNQIYDDLDFHQFISYFKDLGYFKYEKMFAGKNIQNVYTITKEGVSVALDLQKHKDNLSNDFFKNKVSTGILLLTLILIVEPILILSKFTCRYNEITKENFGTTYLTFCLIYILFGLILFLLLNLNYSFKKS